MPPTSKAVCCEWGRIRRNCPSIQVLFCEECFAFLCIPSVQQGETTTVNLSIYLLSIYLFKRTSLKTHLHTQNQLPLPPHPATTAGEDQNNKLRAGS